MNAWRQTTPLAILVTNLIKCVNTDRVYNAWARAR